MKLGIGMKTALSQSLTPQQIQYLKLLQLPMAQLEQQVLQEIEMNPMLEDGDDEDYDKIDLKPLEDDAYPEHEKVKNNEDNNVVDTNDYEQQKEMIDDAADPFEFQNLMWEGSDPDLPQPKNSRNEDDDDFEPFQIKDTGDFMKDMKQQLSLQGVTPEEEVLSEVIMGNLDTDGYLRREMEEIVDETNETIAEINFDRSTAVIRKPGYSSSSNAIHHQNTNGSSNGSNSTMKLSGSYAEMFGTMAPKANDGPKVGHKNFDKESANLGMAAPKQDVSNPALLFALSSASRSLLVDTETETALHSSQNSAYKSGTGFVNGNGNGHSNGNGNGNGNGSVGGINTNPPDYEFKPQKDSDEPKLLKEVDLESAEKVLKRIQRLDPPGLGSRTVKECLSVQLEANHERNPYQDLALEILNKSYEAFAKKHYPVIMKNHKIDEEELRWALEEIRSLNPKPGGLDYQSEMNTVIPDFLIETDDEIRELLIGINDSRMPQLKLSQAYEAMRKEAKSRNINKETKDWLRGKREDAKFLIQALKQRKNTMLKVMTSIAHFQKEFFFEGPDGLRPLIYKDVAEQTGLDISTVCRIVNGKYVLTPFGTFELKFFFSESLPSDEGEEVSTRIIKNKLKDIVGRESKSKPFSDEKLAKLLKEEGFLVARRTVAKYREQLNIPVARLRKEL